MYLNVLRLVKHVHPDVGGLLGHVSLQAGGGQGDEGEDSEDEEY